MTDSYLPEYRERLYPPTVTLSMFMMRALNEDGSRQKAVAGWAAQLQRKAWPGVICLSNGALIDAAIGPRAGVDVLVAQHGSRITDFRRGEKLGARDHRVSRPKPNVRPDWMSRQNRVAFPDRLTLREVRVGGKILVTTMLEPREVNKAEPSDLYVMRWSAGLDLRNIKTTPGMDILSCSTPQMNEKEAWGRVLHNLQAGQSDPLPGALRRHMDEAGALLRQTEQAEGAPQADLPAALRTVPSVCP